MKSLFAQRFYNRSVDIRTGTVMFDGNGNRCLDLVLRDYNMTSQTMTVSWVTRWDYMVTWLDCLQFRIGWRKARF